MPMPAARRAPLCQFDEHEPATVGAEEVAVRAPGAPISAERYREYEKRKQAWIDAQLASGPAAATSFEYDRAILQIARECGI